MLAKFRIRLLSDAFKREGTAVVTDIVFFRKRDRGEPAHHVDPDWLGVAPLEIDGAEVTVKAAHSVEAAPQRIRQPHATAEEPVTARIRRRTVLMPASGPATEADTAAPPKLEQDSFGKMPMTFQERIAMERGQTDGPENSL